MGFTNKTPNYDLPQWIGTDQPTWLVDVNGAFSAIDTAISDVNVNATDAKNTADSASGLANTAKNSADAATQAATDATTAATAATNAATAATEKATQAEQTASAAAGTASTAITNANNAVQVANSAETKADQALAQSGIGTWYKKLLKTSEVEVISQLTKNASYYFTDTLNLFFNDKLKLLVINLNIPITTNSPTLTTSIQGFNGMTTAYFFPIVKIPLSYDSGADISVAGGNIFNYSIQTGLTTPPTVTIAPIYNAGFKMYNGSMWYGMIGNTSSYGPVSINALSLTNFVVQTSRLGNVTLENWEIA